MFVAHVIQDLTFTWGPIYSQNLWCFHVKGTLYAANNNKDDLKGSFSLQAHSVHGFVPKKDGEKTPLTCVAAGIVSDTIYLQFSLVLCLIVKYVLMSPLWLWGQTDKNSDVYMFFAWRNIIRICAQPKEFSGSCNIPGLWVNVYICYFYLNFFC